MKKFYFYDNERILLRENIKPVCLQTIKRDGKTKPPKAPTKQSSGRPKRVRIRSRGLSQGDSTIVCSRCKTRGHNVRSCIKRQRLTGKKGSVEGETKSDENVVDELDLVNELDLS